METSTTAATFSGRSSGRYLMGAVLASLLLTAMAVGSNDTAASVHADPEFGCVGTMVISNVDCEMGVATAFDIDLSHGLAPWCDDRMNTTVYGCFSGSDTEVRTAVERDLLRRIECHQHVPTLQPDGLMRDFEDPRVLDIAARPDGQVMVVTRAGIEWLDRQTGKAGTPIDLPGLDGALIRPDGTILGFDASAGLSGIIDVEGSALIQRSIEIAPFSVATFNDGFAAVIPFNRDSNHVELIDLSSGQASDLALFDLDGAAFLPGAVSPEPDGVWAIDEHNVLARWVGQEQVYQLEIEGSPLTTRRMGDRLAHLSELSDGSQSASLISFDSGSPGLLYSVEADDARAVHPSIDGGMHIVDGDGTFHTFDERGELVKTFATPAVEPAAIVADPATGRVAIAAHGPSTSAGGVVIVDPATGESEFLPGGGDVEHLGFARNGELLAITTGDGLTRLWDVGRGAPGGLVSANPGGVNTIASWYDADSESMWLGVSAKLVQVPMNAQGWIDRACDLAGRDFTQDEWDRFVPGDETLQSAC